MDIKTKINFYGHSFFLITSTEGTKIGTDPYDESVKSPLPVVSADIVLVSHSHYDHNNISLFKGNPEIIKNAGSYEIKNVKINGFNSYHDKSKGMARGKNIIFKFIVDEIKFAHLGDLGDVPDENVLNDLKDLDIMFIPVGGIFTINAKEAVNLIEILKPKIAIPMHFKEKDTMLRVDNINPFKNNIPKNISVKEFSKNFEITKEELPEKTAVWIIYSS